MHIHPKKAGTVLGVFFGVAHIVWSLFVLFGWGQGLVNFIFKLHMVTIPYTVGPFDITMAVSLVVVTTVIGYILGAIFALLWNRIHA